MMTNGSFGTMFFPLSVSAGRFGRRGRRQGDDGADRHHCAEDRARSEDNCPDSVLPGWGDRHACRLRGRDRIHIGCFGSGSANRLL